MSITVLGVDPSLSNTGLCWGSGPKEHVLKCVGYRPTKGETFKAVVDRVRRINGLIYMVEDQLNEFIKPDYVMIEEYAYSRHQVATQAEYGGILRCRLIDHTTEVIEVGALQVKKFALGKGKGDKNQMLLQVFKRWDVECENDDEADAYVLYRIGLCYAGICEPETQAQAEVIKKLKGE